MPMRTMGLGMTFGYPSCQRFAQRRHNLCSFCVALRAALAEI